MMGSLWKVLTRRKAIDPQSQENSQLSRVLNTIDLTALGVGSTLGVGVYVIAGHVAKDTAGPAVILSFLIAAIASVFAGLCYAEFGARTPRAGSAYIYSYICIGEFIAFVIGWNLVLEYVIGSASVARGLSLYLDTLLNNTLKDTFRDIAPINVAFMSEYFDFFACGISLILSVGLAFGMKESTKVNNIFTLLNLAVVVFVIIAGAIKSDTHNWDLPTPPNNTTLGTGGFMPFGVSGVIKGAATCFYGFVGFDCIATSGEEVKNPQKAIPISIIVSLFIIFLAYFGTSTVVTLMLPYYDQDPNAPIPHAFDMVDWEWAKWIVAIGGIFGLCASLFGAMFPLPRILYAMASDGLVFRFLGKINSHFRTPVIGTVLAGLLTGLMSALFDLKQLVNMMSIGTLLAYTIVAASVLLLRYENDKKPNYELLRASSDSSDDEESYSDSRNFDEGGVTDESSLMNGEPITTSGVFNQIFNCGRISTPTKISELIVNVEIFIYCVLCVLIGLCAMYLQDPLRNGEIWAIVLTSIVVGLTVIVMMSIATQPKSSKLLPFKVPLLPLIPALSILINIYLMLMLDSHTWIRFAVWMAVGLPTYYFSVKTPSDARNSSVVTLNPSISTLKLNSNEKPYNDLAITTPPSKNNGIDDGFKKDINTTIKELDDYLENAESVGERKFSTNSSVVDVSLRENVIADIHHAASSLIISMNEPLTVEMPTDDDGYVTFEDIESSREEIGGPESPPPTQSSDLVEDRNETSIPTPPPLPPVDFVKESGIVKPPPPQSPETSEEVIIPTPPPTPSSERGEEMIIPHKMSDANIAAPPPPLQEDSHGMTPSMPKLKLTASTLRDNKLRNIKRKAPETPPVDGSAINTAQDNDNLKFGSLECEAFREKLDKNLQLPQKPPLALILPLRNSLSDRAIVTPKEPNENVIEEGFDRIHVKDMLNFFLSKNPTRNDAGSDGDDERDVQKKVEESVESKSVPTTPTSVLSSSMDDQKVHRAMMGNTLRSIKSRKEDEFENGGEDI